MPSQRITYPPLVAHGPQNHGAVVVVITYSFMFIAILLALVRTYSTLAQKRVIKWNDITFSLATLLLIPESIITERAVGQGLGQHIEVVPTSHLIQYYKLIYATQILGIIIQTLAKWSVVILMERISGQAHNKNAVLVLKASIGIWALFSILTIAFQCGIPDPWIFTSDNCAAQGKLYYLIIVGNIITDALLSGWLIPVVSKLQMHKSVRHLVSFLFVVRFVVCAASIAHIASFPKYIASDDKTWANTIPQIMHQVVVNTSVILAGIPSVNRFLSDVQTGRMGVVLNDREIEMTSSGRSRSKNSKNNSKTGGSHNSSGLVRSGGRPSKGDISHPHLKGVPTSNATEVDHIEAIRTHPSDAAQISTRVMGGSDGAKKKKGAWGGWVSEEEVVDDDSTSSLKKSGVFQQTELEMHVEYDYGDGTHPGVRRG